MKYPLLSSNDTKVMYFHNVKAGYKQAFIFKVDTRPIYVMAKSIIKGVVEKDYPHRSDPYIYKIKKLLPDDVNYFKMVDLNLLKKVWHTTTGNYSSVVFVKVDALLPVLPIVFPELERDSLNSLQLQLHEMQLSLIKS